MKRMYIEEKGASMRIGNGFIKGKERITAALHKSQQVVASQRGMTLVELMAALALLVIVFTGFMTLATASSQMNIKAETMRSQFEAQQKNIVTDTDLEDSNATIDLKVGSDTISLDVIIKTAKGSEPLAIFE